MYNKLIIEYISMINEWASKNAVDEAAAKLTANNYPISILHCGFNISSEKRLQTHPTIMIFCQLVGSIG